MSAAVSRPAVRERPVIFSAPMVTAILAGQKTVTRRIVKGAFHDDRSIDRWDAFADGTWEPSGDCGMQNGLREAKGPSIRCPFGAPGDMLWVREAIWHRRIATGHHEAHWGESRVHDVRYVADDPYKPVRDCSPDEEFVKRSPIFMPRWTSRLTLEIASVRVERLQQITDVEIEAEGFECAADGCSFYPLEEARQDGQYPDARTAFATGWDRLNGKRSRWSDDPFVWRIEFLRMGGRS